MSIKFRVMERGQPGVVGGGEKKFYATPVSDGELTLRKLTKQIEKISTVSGADIRAVVYAMVDVMRDSLEEGQIVRLGDLGSLRISIQSAAADSAEGITEDSIKGARTIFTPGVELKDLLKHLDYKKVS